MDIKKFGKNAGQNLDQNAGQILGLFEVADYCNMTVSEIYRAMNDDIVKFPKGEKPSEFSRRVWQKVAIDDWIEAHNNNPLLGMEEVSEMLGISVGSIRRYIKVTREGEAKIPFPLPETMWGAKKDKALWRKSKIQDYMDKRPEIRAQYAKQKNVLTPAKFISLEMEHKLKNDAELHVETKDGLQIVSVRQSVHDYRSFVLWDAQGNAHDAWNNKRLYVKHDNPDIDTMIQKRA